MRVAIDYTPALAEKAGIGRFARGLVAGLAALDSHNCYALVVPRGASTTARPNLPPNFGLRRLPLPERWMTILWHRLRLPLPVEALVGGCDVFHSVSFVLPPLARARGLVTIHDLSYLVHPECANSGLVRYLTQAVPRAVHRAHLVLADSENTRKDTVRLLGVPPDRVEVVYGGVDAGFAPVRDPARLDAVRQCYGLSSPFILAVGTLEPRKNLSRLLDAFQALRQQGRLEHQLLLAGGRGWLFNDLVRKAEATEGVRLLGFVPDADLPALFSLADLFVFPSLYEGFGLPVLEAMACGVPVVASGASSVPEVVGEAALLVDPYDTAALAEAIERAVHDRDLRPRLVEAGFAQARRFTWEAAARKLLEVNRRVASAGPAH